MKHDLSVTLLLLIMNMNRMTNNMDRLCNCHYYTSIYPRILETIYVQHVLFTFFFFFSYDPSHNTIMFILNVIHFFVLVKYWTLSLDKLIFFFYVLKISWIFSRGIIYQFFTFNLSLSFFLSLFDFTVKQMLLEYRF